jgi:flagellin FlaB
MKRLLGTLRLGHRDERGITGLETAIILIAFVVVATVFAFVVLTTGVFSSERGKESVYAGLQKARGTLELRGGVVVSATGCPTCTVDDIVFAVANSAGGEPVSLATTGDNRTILAYRDETTIDNDVTYTISVIVGDTDDLLEAGELFNVSVDTSTGIDGTTSLTANKRFTIEVQAPLGGVLDITRQLPAELSTVMQLH